MIKKRCSQFSMSICFICTFLFGFSNCSDINKVQTKDKFSTIETQFKEPPNEYRSAPLLVWNGKMTESEIDRMLKDAKEVGFGGVFIHPRPGMITEYISDDWYSLYKYAIAKGKELGLNVWIYDENSYPSGFAGGHVPEEMPESYNQGQGLALEKTDLLPDTMNQYYICLVKEKDAWKDITSSLAEYKGKKGEYYLYRKTYYRKSDWYGGYSYVDLLLPGVTEKFIEITMKGYEKIAKEEFGKTVPGIFTDEPNIVTSGGLRWTPDLFDVFQKRWGYDLKPLLPLLSQETGDWKRVRHNYMETLLQLFIDRWSKPWHAYTESKNLKWTGHYWEHGWPQMNDGPDNMAMYAWHQIPAIDMLFNQFDEESPQAQFGNIRSVKELRSVANQMGYIRTLSETYGGGGWDETFKDFKRLGDWEFVLGVNFMNQHLSHQTLTGARKYDYPPVFSYHSPWWNNYKVMNDYYARLSLMLSKGVQQNEILILEPNSTLWGYYSHTGSGPKLMEIGKTFQSFITKLEKSQVEYDLGSENIIKDQGRIENGRFVVGQASYSKVVIPPMVEILNKPTADLLTQFVKQGGHLICFSSPTMVDGVENEELKRLTTGQSVKIISELTPQVIKESFTCTNFNLDSKGGKLYHQRRNYADGELIFLVNSSMDEAVTGELTSKGKAMLEMDAISGDIYSYPSVLKEKNLITKFKLEPAQSLLLFCSQKAKNNRKQKPSIYTQSEVPSTGEITVKRRQDNALNIDFCDLTVNGKTYPDLYFANAADSAYKAYGFINGNPWNTSVQYKRTILDRDTFKSEGFDVQYHFIVNQSFDYSKMKLVAERSELFTVKINGETVNPNIGEWWLDQSFHTYPIGEQVRKGINTVELSVKPMSIYAEIEPVYILGDFSVVPAKKGWNISAPVPSFHLGSWKEQGQPFYSWDFSYSKTYNLNDLSKQYSVKLGKWNGTVAEVYVNGKKAGIIGFEPYVLPVSPYLKEGENQIEVRIIGSLKNLLGPHYRHPAPGLASPWHWKNITEQMPGSDYQMMDYGLIDDFSLVY